ncbi:unnamed protein product [Ceutorhynchus assimilis]|uniref:Coiled-coil domain-containing protein 43 n=1 Tax=Ceutorhynchus assimilis TaxID=467358 RepID=A0A9N9MX55_9CUCU|nr:unnamed protein product [Ceutorhynchus assimilis]
MATAAPVENVEFSSWLSEKLQEFNTDEEVFGSYITGILDSDDPDEEKAEALEGILTEIVVNGDISKISTEILTKWQSLKPKDEPPQRATTEEINEKLAKLLESQSLATTKQKQYTDEEKKIREAILSQYSQMTDSEEEDENGAVAPAEPKDNNLEKNINVQLVAEAEKQKREQNRLDSQKKKEKDKEDREKQKQLREDKKEKRKTQKGERKR